MKKKVYVLLAILAVLFLLWAIPHNVFNRTINYIKLKIFEVIDGHRNAREILETVGEYDGKIAIEVNDNHPFFTVEDLASVYDDQGRIISYEKYSDLDVAGRAQTAMALIGEDLMPVDDREPIESIRPSGWHGYVIPEEEMEDGSIYLYNRCHLIAFCLTGENDNEKNLITGCRSFNLAMKEYEVQVARYVQRTHNHVLYRVTPVYRGLNALANGVLIEAYSIEDNGSGICLCIFIHNVQPLREGSVIIDYVDGTAEYKPKNGKE